MWIVGIRYKDATVDPHVQELSKVILDLGIKGINQIERIVVYAITGTQTERELEIICKELLVDPLIQYYRYSSPKQSLLDLVTDQRERGKWLALIQYRPSVTDPSEERIRNGIRVLGIETVYSVKTASLYMFQGSLTKQVVETICEKVLANDVIQVHSTCELDHCTKDEVRIYGTLISDTPKIMDDQTRPLVEEICLRNADDTELMRTSKEWRLSLNLTEMKRIQEHYVSEGREPTDIELNTIAQTWSEHCYHKTFKIPIETTDQKINGLLKTYIMRATKELNKPWCISTFVDNAGIVEFDEEYGIAVKVETHNHPTALDPFGGAGTGTGGVLRDIMGVGAKPILSTDILFFGLLDTPHEKLPRGLLHPIRMMKGAVAGIADYGNKMGIPTANGAIFFDEGYLYNPLVFAGSVGIMPRTKYVRNPQQGDIILVVGGKTGMDGIHGVTFASAELSEETQSLGSAVQIGNPVEEKKVLEGLLRTRDRYEKPLYNAVTDCGGGGLSSAIGETARDLGAIVDLEKVPLKHKGMKPWQIWISESQERMMLAVPEENVEETIAIFEEENCEATPIGKFTETGRLVLRYQGKVVGELDLEFLHRGVPLLPRRAIWEKEKFHEPDFRDEKDLGKYIILILGSPNVASKEWVIRQYDHEVQANTINKPLQGANCDGPGDACVLKPLVDSWQGVVVSNGANPRYSIDPYNMALSVIDEAIRNNICSGGRRIAILDNFSWGNPERPDQLGKLLDAVRGCYDAALGFGTPFISGKDSLYNEYIQDDGQTVAIPPTLVITALGIIPDTRKAITMDVKEAGNPIYIVGETFDELGGSHYYAVRGFVGNNVPTVRIEAAKSNMDALIQAMDAGLVRACHDCSEGGIGIAAAEMAFAGDLGIHLKLSSVPSTITQNDKILFSESNSRFIVEVASEKAGEFEQVMADSVCVEIGEVTKARRLVVEGVDGKIVVKESLDLLKDAWQSTFRW